VGQVFISYRRNDQPGSAGRLFDRLSGKVEGRVFMDVHGIPGGHDYTKVIDDRVEVCDVVLAVVGDRWLTETDPATGKRRIDLADDFVRRELVAGLRMPNRVIPVLLDNVDPFRRQDLPEVLQKLADTHVLRLDHARFDDDVDRIVEAVQVTFKKSRPWDRVRFMATASDTKGAAVAEGLARVLDWAAIRGLGIRWGSGAKIGSFILLSKDKGRAIFSGQTDGAVFFYMAGLERAGILSSDDDRKAAIKKLNQLRGLAIAPERSDKDYVGFPIRAVGADEMPKLLSILGEIFDGKLGALEIAQDK
jgi:hypothetical protein